MVKRVVRDDWLVGDKVLKRTFHYLVTPKVVVRLVCFVISINFITLTTLMNY